VVGCAAGLAFLFLSGCGGSSHPKSTGTSTAATTSAPATPMTKSQARTLAQALGLKPADVAGFKAVPVNHTESAQEQALTRQLETCAGGAGKAHKLAEAKSDEFKRAVKGLPVEVSSTVAIEESPAYAEQDLRAIRSARGRRCIVRLVDAAFKGKKFGGASIGAGSIREGSPPAAGTNGSFGVRLTVPISAPGITVKAYFDFLGFVHGPEEVTLQSIGVGEPFPAATQEHLFAVLVARASSHALP